MVKQRLKKGEWIAMSPEDKLKWKRFLQRRWRQNHPETVKQSNKHWAEFYKKVKPHLIACRGCGTKFYAARKNRHLCDSCLENRHQRQIVLKQELKERKKAREKFLKDITKMWESGIPQTQIAKKYGRTQSGISALLRRKGIITKNT